MRERLELRLIELRKQFQQGQKLIYELESKLADVRTTVVRISGAIQVLEEELSSSSECSKTTSQGGDGMDPTMNQQHIKTTPAEVDKHTEKGMQP